jgi:hypothetical protein
MRRYGLRDDQWNRIKDLLSGREGHVAGTAKDNRLFVEAVLYRFTARPPSFGEKITTSSMPSSPVAANSGPSRASRSAIGYANRQPSTSIQKRRSDCGSIQPPSPKWWPGRTRWRTSCSGRLYTTWVGNSLRVSAAEGCHAFTRLPHSISKCIWSRNRFADEDRD